MQGTKEVSFVHRAFLHCNFINLDPQKGVIYKKHMILSIYVYTYLSMYTRIYMHINPIIVVAGGFSTLLFVPLYVLPLAFLVSG